MVIKVSGESALAVIESCSQGCTTASMINGPLKQEKAFLKNPKEEKRRDSFTTTSPVKSEDITCLNWKLKDKRTNKKRMNLFMIPILR